jgi:hypothetical protein
MGEFIERWASKETLMDDSVTVLAGVAMKTSLLGNDSHCAEMTYAKKHARPPYEERHSVKSIDLAWVRSTGNSYKIHLPTLFRLNLSRAF